METFNLRRLGRRFLSAAYQPEQPKPRHLRVPYVVSPWFDVVTVGLCLALAAIHFAA